jgi:hypothetical protein
MATKGKKASPKASKRAVSRPAAKKGKRSRTYGSGSPPNYLIYASDGLYVRSGLTGELRKLTDEEASAIGDLLQKRQKLGQKLAERLAGRGFSLAASEIWDGPPPWDE